jgi:hypothetical protein
MVDPIMTVPTIRTWKFTFHTAMLRDKLGELSMGRDVEIVKKVPDWAAMSMLIAH